MSSPLLVTISSEASKCETQKGKESEFGLFGKALAWPRIFGKSQRFRATCMWTDPKHCPGIISIIIIPGRMRVHFYEVEQFTINVWETYLRLKIVNQICRDRTELLPKVNWDYGVHIKMIRDTHINILFQISPLSTPLRRKHVFCKCHSSCNNILHVHSIHVER